MTSKPDLVQLPPDLLGMFHLARDAFVFYETETGSWEEETLIRFRDVLFDLVQAAEADSRDMQQYYVGAAMEHLTLAVSEPLQNRTEELLAQLNRPLKLLKVFRLTHQYGNDFTEANAADIRRRIDYYLAEGRTAKARITFLDAQKAYDSFREAYHSTVFLRESLKSRKPKLPVSALLWLLSVVLAGVIGAIITQLF